MNSFQSVNLYPESDMEKENRKGTAGFLPIGPISPTINVENCRPNLTPKINPGTFLDMTETLSHALKTNEPAIVKQGWLKKQKTSGFMRGWKQRWCVLFDNGLFRYYSEAPLETEMEFGGDEKYRKGKGDVSFARLKTFGIDGHMFWLGTSKRIWRFAAINAEGASSWFEHMTRPHLEYEAARTESLQTISFMNEAEMENYSPPNLERPPALSRMFRAPTPSKSNSQKPGRRLSFSTALEQMRQNKTTHAFNASDGGDTPSGRSFGRSFTVPDLLSCSAMENEIEDDVLKAGWLHKQGGRFGFWKRRWCELYRDGTFRYWASPEKTEAQRKGKGDVYFHVIKASGQDGQEFWVETSDRVWIFQAETCIDASDWLVHFVMPQNLRTKKKVVAPSHKYQFWASKRSLTEDEYAFDDVRTSVCTDYLNGLENVPFVMQTPKFCDDHQSSGTESTGTESMTGCITPVNTKRKEYTQIIKLCSISKEIILEKHFEDKDCSSESESVTGFITPVSITVDDNKLDEVDINVQAAVN